MQPLVKTTDTSTILSSSGGMNNGTSRWGVRGSEDLGGGLKAGFNFEDGLSLNDGAVNQSGGQLLLARCLDEPVGWLR